MGWDVGVLDAEDGGQGAAGNLLAVGGVQGPV